MSNEVQNKPTHRLYIGAGIFFILFLMLGSMVVLHGEIINEFDHAIFNFLNPTKMPFLTKFMNGISDLGSPAFNTVLAMLIVGVLSLFRHFRLGIFIFMTFFGGSALALLFKVLVQRPRPSGKLVIDSGYSFPSGHVFTTSMIAFVLALIIYKKSQSVLVHDVTYVLAGLWVMTVAISRVFLRDHYPSDVLGSMLLACAVICFALGLFRQVTKNMGRTS
jgi:undecaprenyl-diphosphatase